MTALLLVSLILPFLAPTLARRTLHRLVPATVPWVLTVSTLALAGTCVAATPAAPARRDAFLMVVCAVLSVAAGTAGVVDVHRGVEIAQGENGP
ncbi:hypothetical protein ABZT03_32475 [Streptomyces sp. NPDC005574]|uniref:hypothetical protein n=1 Tax=Streptomyces sp. NPDC005574 TaxID=3156891 RepID=UPI0033A27A3A